MARRARLALAVALVACVVADDTHHDHDHHANHNDMDHSMDHDDSGDSHRMVFSTNYRMVSVLFEGWSNMSPAAYAGTIVGMIAFGLLSESIVVLQRYVDAGIESTASISIKMRIVRSLVYGLQHTVHFLLMLCAMTFDVGIFVAIMCGFTLGFFIFSSGSPGFGAHHLKENKFANP